MYDKGIVLNEPAAGLSAVIVPVRRKARLQSVMMCEADAGPYVGQYRCDPSDERRRWSPTFVTENAPALY